MIRVFVVEIIRKNLYFHLCIHIVFIIFRVLKTVLKMVKYKKNQTFNYFSWILHNFLDEDIYKHYAVVESVSNQRQSSPFIVNFQARDVNDSGLLITVASLIIEIIT